MLCRGMQSCSRSLEGHRRCKELRKSSWSCPEGESLSDFKLNLAVILTEIVSEGE